MSTPAPTTPQAARTGSPRELRIYMHTWLLYWWPVWVIGYVMAAWTMIENQHMALVPAGAVVEGNTLTTPDATVPMLTAVHISSSRVPGLIFVLTILTVLTFGSGWMRGWRAYTFAAVSGAVLMMVSWLHWWDDIAHLSTYLSVYINFGGYLIFSTGLLVLWLVQFYVVDRRRYVVFSFSQMRIHDEIGEEEKVYDTGGVSFEKEQYDWFRRVVGRGAGDLRVHLRGQTLEIPNVIHVGRQLDEIETLMRTKDVE